MRAEINSREGNERGKKKKTKVKKKSSHNVKVVGRRK